MSLTLEIQASSHPTARSSRLQLSGEVDTSADYTEWEIDSLEADAALYYPITVTTNDLGQIGSYANILDADSDFLDIWLPPYQNFRVRVRQIGSTDSRLSGWSDWVTFQSVSYLNSYDRGRVLSGETITTERYTLV